MVDLAKEPSLDQLQQRSEKTREHLAETVDVLRMRLSETADDVRHKLSPETLKDGVRDYVNDTRQQLVHSLEQRARDNPLQAAAIAVVAAYPIWRLIRSIPAPILLVGAGVALARPNSRAKQTSDKLLQHAQSRVREGTDRLMQSARSRSDAVQDKAREAMAQASDTVDRVKSGLADGVDAVQSAVAGTLDSVTGAIGSSADTVNRFGSTSATYLSDRAQAFRADGKDALGQAFEHYPLLVAIVGLTVGGSIAASLPTLAAEDRLLGEASAQVKDKAREAAAGVLDTAVSTAERIYEDTLRAAKEQGLSPEAVQAALHDIADKLKAVATRTAAVATDAADANGTAKQPLAEQNTNVGGDYE